METGHGALDGEVQRVDGDQLDRGAMLVAPPEPTQGGMDLLAGQRARTTADQQKRKDREPDDRLHTIQRFRCIGEA